MPQTICGFTAFFFFFFKLLIRDFNGKNIIKDFSQNYLKCDLWHPHYGPFEQKVADKI